jgi:hypothetical protein
MQSRWDVVLTPTFPVDRQRQSCRTRRPGTPAKRISEQYPRLPVLLLLFFFLRLARLHRDKRACFLNGPVLSYDIANINMEICGGSSMSPIIINHNAFHRVNGIPFMEEVTLLGNLDTPKLSVRFMSRLRILPHFHVF